ncbi:MAG: single-stranded-DNA-specific exonuclease RecJ [Clostridia bacterium]|nr:single-stranded-DNA-specific exonuclease RecJ [Clostridia bacterium]
MAQREWLLKQPAATEALLQSGCPRVLAVLLANRGFTGPDEARLFLSASGGFCEPLLLTGMAAAAQRINRAVDAGEKICVYGDYDVDGVTAAALLLLYLRGRGADVFCYIPEREGEGYGLNNAALEKIAALGSSLAVTVDTGISAVEEAQTARELGLDLIITDHHRPRDLLPEACAVVDPKLPGSEYPFRELAGVGVALKLACALEGCGTQQMLARYGDLACLGTVADVVPLTGENRAIVKYGLKRIAKQGNPGIRALIDASGAGGRPVTASLLGFTLAPRINACGRMSSAGEALELLTTDDTQRTAELAQTLNENNRLRQETEGAILAEAHEMSGQDPELIEAPVIILSGEGWHNGVIGIVAARIAESYLKPVILISFDGDEGRASCRSLPGFDIFKALSACSDLLVKYGGHELAAGFTIRAELLEDFRGAMFDYAFEQPEPPHSVLELECALAPGELTLKTAKHAMLLEPCGSGNPAPLFLISGALVKSVTPVKEGKHLRVALVFSGRPFTAMLFNAARADFQPAAGDCVDLAVSLDADVYNGTERLSVLIRDLRPAQEEPDLYQIFTERESLGVPEALYPVRTDFEAVYRFLRPAGAQGVFLDDALSEAERSGLGPFKLRVILDVFEEGGLVGRAERQGRISVAVNAGVRMELEQSKILKKLKVAEGNERNG